MVDKIARIKPMKFYETEADRERQKFLLGQIQEPEITNNDQDIIYDSEIVEELDKNNVIPSLIAIVKPLKLSENELFELFHNVWLQAKE